MTLDLEAKPASIDIMGISNTSATSSEIARVTLKSRINSFSATMSYVITDRITGLLPAVTVKRYELKLPSNV